MRVSKEFKVGLLVVLGLLLVFVLVNTLKGESIFGRDREFYAEFDNSSGLQASNAVQLNGVKVGQVLSVDLHPNNAQKVLVKFSIQNEELQIPRNSEAWLISSDILGTKALDIRMDMDKKEVHAYYEDGDTMRSVVEKDIQAQINEQILPLKKKTEELITSVEHIIVSVNSFWDTTAAAQIDQGLYEVRDAIGTFGELANSLSILISKETEMVDKILTDVHEITDNLASKSEQVSNTLDNISAISDTLADSDIKGVLTEAENTLTEFSELMGKVNDGEGTLGALLHSDSLYNELVQTNQSVQSLLEDVEANPNKYVHFSLFGRKVKGVQLSAQEEQKLKDMLDE
ncbi:MAG: MlaD family protein [Flavobacteriales bacterium]|jgi:phospholipid/cholesterol/gamma-HCH transport system substrate-binding protein|nr:MlaD family protein [Flavobacteriales bacterium]